MFYVNKSGRLRRGAWLNSSHMRAIEDRLVCVQVDGASSLCDKMQPQFSADGSCNSIVQSDHG